MEKKKQKTTPIYLYPFKLPNRWALFEGEFLDLLEQGSKWRAYVYTDSVFPATNQWNRLSRCKRHLHGHLEPEELAQLPAAQAFPRP